MIGGVLFDKDGTLVDFRRTWLPAYLGMARDLAEHVLGSCAEQPVRDLAGLILCRLGYETASDRFAADSLLLWATNDDLAQAIAAQPELEGVDAAAIAGTHLSDAERYPAMPVGDLRALFRRLRLRGLQIGIATMDSTRSAQDLVARCCLGEYLAFVAGYDAGYGVKPEAGMIDGFCRATGLAPGEIVVVGDTLADFAMARGAGAAATLAVLTGALPAEALVPHADAVLPDVHHLEAWLDESEGLQARSAAANKSPPEQAPR